MKAHFPSWFSLLILAVVIMFTISASSFTPRAKFIPLFVAIPLLSLVFLQILTEIFPKQFAKFSKTDLTVGIKHKTAEILSAYKTNDAGAKNIIKKDSLLPIVYLMLLFFLIIVCGLIIGGALYITALYRFTSKASWSLSIITAVLLIGACYTLFEILLNITIWQGILFK